MTTKPQNTFLVIYILALVSAIVGLFIGLVQRNSFIFGFCVGVIVGFIGAIVSWIRDYRAWRSTKVDPPTPLLKEERRYDL